MSSAMAGLNRSLDVDSRLWRDDIRGSKAWARALTRASVLNEEEGERLVAGLERVEEVLAGQDPSSFPDEDIHTLVERLLGDEVGDLAGKLHTGRSRNDQVATDVRLWGMDACATVQANLAAVLESLVSLAERSLALILPGYTHLQQAQPVSASHWVLSHFWPLARDWRRFGQVRDAAGSLPLGSGALSGCPFPVDRDWLMKELGFHVTSENSLDAVSDRDWMAEGTFGAALLGIHLSRLGEDLVLFSSREFGFVRIPDSLSTGSSLMPQKRNPDSAELIRGKAGRLLGNLSGLLGLLKGLPTGYNRDLQEDKGFLFDSVDTLLLVLPVVQELVTGLEFREDRIQDALEPGLLATELADYLVRKGVPFRESHHVVGRLVRTAETRGCPVSQLPLEVFQVEHPLFGEDVWDRLSYRGAVESRQVGGGTAGSAVESQLGEARRFLSQARSASGH